MSARVLVCVPENGFDPTEVAVPASILKEGGADIVFASPRGASPVRADPIMVDGTGLYFLKWSMRADANGRKAYNTLVESGALDHPVSFDIILRDGVEGYGMLLLPGGHCPDMKPYLEDQRLLKITQMFHAAGKPIAAVCHGVVVAARSGVLKDKKVTALPSWMETLAYSLTRLWMGDYYKTYRGTSVEREVTEACKEFVPGPKSLTRDSMGSLESGFVVEDGNIITARWPGDCHRLGVVLRKRLLGP